MFTKNKYLIFSLFLLEELWHQTAPPNNRTQEMKLQLTNLKHIRKKYKWHLREIFKLTPPA